jgi:hypothetical protein
MNKSEYVNQYYEAFSKMNAEKHMNKIIAIIFIIVGFYFIGCGGSDYYKVIEGRTRLDDLPVHISNEDFVRNLINEYEQSKKPLSHFGGNRFGFASCNGRVITLNLSLWSSGYSLGQAARDESAWAISLLLWLGASRMEAIEKIKIYWKATDDKDNTVNFNAHFIPKLYLKKLDRLIFTEKILYSHQEDSLARLRDYIADISSQSFIVSLDTASGKTMKSVRKY